jgi:hypothetical protein
MKSLSKKAKAAAYIAARSKSAKAGKAATDAYDKSENIRVAYDHSINCYYKAAKAYREATEHEVAMWAVIDLDANK